MARREASRCGEAQADYRSTKSCAEVADGKCHSGRIAECACCWKETGSAEPSGGEAFRGTWRVACSETFRNSGRFTNTKRRQTDDPDYTRTETITSRSGAGDIAQCPEVGSTETE